MATVLLSIGVLLLIVGVMSIGVLMGREPIKGSCGGMSALGMDTACDLCGGSADRCEKNSEVQADERGDLAYEASSPPHSSNTPADNRR